MIIERRKICLKNDFITESGFRLVTPEVAYETYGTPGKPAILVTHGGLQDHRIAGNPAPEDLMPRHWDSLIGPNKVINTNHFWVISANFLGSMFGTCGPTSINPQTGKPYQGSFPTITLTDTVRFHKLFLEELGVNELELMIGPSTGGLQTLEMAALYPKFVKKAVAIAAAPKMPPEGIAVHLAVMNTITADPAFNNGFYDPQKTLPAMKIVAQFLKIYFIQHRILKKLIWDNFPNDATAHFQRIAAIQSFLTAGIEEQLKDRDPNSYLRILEAVNSFDLAKHANNYEAGVQRITCPLLIINIETDTEFPPFWADEVAEIIHKIRPGQVSVAHIDSDWGHLGCLKETQKITQLLNDFLAK